MLERKVGRARRHAKIRAHVKGTAEKPRLSMFRSNKQVVCQLIDDVKGVTLAAASGVDLKKEQKGTKTERATLVGRILAERALEKNIKTIAFDRGGYKYHGRVKAVAEELRQKGLEF
jgi:large subunit ribosomal protein L18